MKKIYACFLAFVILLSFVVHAQTLRSEFPITNERVNTIIRYNGTIYIGGWFTSITDPQTGISYERNHLAAFDAVTGAILPWNPPVASDDYLFVTTLAVGDNIIYAGGFFGVNGQPELEDLVALDPITGAVSSWYPDLKKYGSKTIQKIVVAESKVFVTGAFVNSSSGELENILAFDAISGQRVSEFSNLSDDVASAIAVKDDNLYIGGNFTSLNSSQRQNIAALDASSGAVLSWNPAADAIVRSLKIKDNTLYVGGIFTGFGYDPVNKSVAVSRNGVAAIDATTGTVLPWNPLVDGLVESLDIHGNNVYIGGSFTQINGQSRRSVAMIDAATGALSSWNPDADALVYEILASDNAVFVSGNFTSIAGQARQFFAALAPPAESAPLPVKFSFFEGKAQSLNSALLQWQTGNEQNANRFEIQQSINGIDFIKAGQVKAKGNATSTSNYQFLYKGNMQVKNFFRLKQVDADGSFSYSSIISVAENKVNKILIVPNPVKNRVTILSKDNIQQVNLFNSLGILIKSIVVNSDHLSMDLSGLIKGIYYLQAQSGNQKAQQILMKE